MTMTSNSASIAGSGVMNSWPLLNLCTTESVKIPNHLPPMYVIARSYKQCDPAGLWAVADPGEGPQGSGPSPYFQTKMLSRSHLHGGNNSPQSAFYTDWLFSLSPVTAPEVFAKVNSTRPNWPLQKIPYIPYCSLFVPPKFCISIVFNFSWELKWPQEKHNAYVKCWEDKKRALWLPVDKMHKGRGQLTIIFTIF